MNRARRAEAVSMVVVVVVVERVEGGETDIDLTDCGEDDGVCDASGG